MEKGEHADKEAHKKRLRELQEKTRRRVDYHLQRAYFDPEDFYHLVTEFFLELLQKEYSATYEDILDELESIEHNFFLFTKEQRARAQELLSALSHIEYSAQQIPQEEAKDILKKFRLLADEFTTFEEESVQRALRSGFDALEHHRLDDARDSYKTAHRLYQKLGEGEKKQYHAQLQELFKKISVPAH